MKFLIASIVLSLASVSHADPLETLQTMADDPASIDQAYTGARPGTDESATVDASRAGSKAGPLAVSSKEMRKRPVSVNKARGYNIGNGSGVRRDDGFVDGIKTLVSSVASWGVLGAIVGLLIGVFGSPAIVAATVSGAMIGATVGLVFGVFGMLSAWSQ